MHRHIKKFTKYVLIRYIISGGTSAFVDLFFLFILNTVLSIHYLLSATIAFLMAFGVSFTLHKFWTFKTDAVHNTRRQIIQYLLASLFGLSLNTLLMYIFVDHFHIFVLLSQIFAGIMVACCTFFISRHLVFKYKKGTFLVEEIEP